jgi:hypothetical protein
LSPWCLIIHLGVAHGDTTHDDPSERRPLAADIGFAALDGHGLDDEIVALRRHGQVESVIGLTHQHRFPPAT